MKVAVLLSGGVDSSVALAIAVEQGHSVRAYYLKIWLEDEMAFMGECPWEEDLYYARAVCEKYDVPLKIINMQREYFDVVVGYTLTELKAGRTPSPDIMCNKNIKFGIFFDKCPDEFDKVYSGHYATIKEIDNKFHLYRAKDPIKDQTYFLTYLNQEQLSKIVFPLGIYMKSEVRQLAETFGLLNAIRKDSQGICFLGKIKYNDFVKFNIGENIGNIVEFETKEILGKHNGYWFHTIGQRQGLGLSGGPWYVVKKDIKNNIIYVSHSLKFTSVSQDTYYVNHLNWLVAPPSKKSLQTKVRHGARKYECDIEFLENEKILVKLAEEDQALSPGQFSIFYDGEECIGGGIIELKTNN